jgi:hypothetical protein
LCFFFGVCDLYFLSKEHISLWCFALGVRFGNFTLKELLIMSRKCNVPSPLSQGFFLSTIRYLKARFDIQEVNFVVHPLLRLLLRYFKGSVYAMYLCNFYIFNYFCSFQSY